MSRRTASAVVCTYSDSRWPWLCDALRSLREQTHPPDEVLVVVDHNDALLRRARDEFPQCTVIANDEAAGLAGARNTGIRHSSCDVVVFMDDDAVAEPDCLRRLLEPYRDPRVAGSGGAAVPEWPGARPRWFPSEFDWVVGCSYTGLPQRTARIRNPIGACMSFRRAVFQCTGGFTSGFGRTGADAMGCEETELAIRVQRAFPGSMVVYVPDARVVHRVDEPRARWRYFIARCYAEGRSKARVTRAVGRRDALSSERDYAKRVLPAAALRGVGQGLAGEAAGLLRAAAIGAGLAAAGAGYLRARIAIGALR